MIYSVIKEPFGNWVKQQIETRNRKVAVEKNLLIEMDPEVAEIYAASTAVSSKLIFIIDNDPNKLIYLHYIASKGIGANMLKVGTKRRRTTMQIQAEKEEAAIKEASI